MWQLYFHHGVYIITAIEVGMEMLFGRSGYSLLDSSDSFDVLEEKVREKRFEILLEWD